MENNLTNIANLAIVANDLKLQIDTFIDNTKTKREDVTAEESTMYEYLQKASYAIRDYLETQQMNDRKFEVGKQYYDKWYDVFTVESKTDKAVKFVEQCGHSRISPYYHKHGEEVRGNLEVKS